MPKLLARQLQFRLGEHHMAYQPAIPLEGTFLFSEAWLKIAISITC